MQSAYLSLRFVVLAAMFWGMRDSVTSAVHLTPPPTPVPATYFGMHIHRPSPDTWPQIPFSEWRLWDSKDAIWYKLEPRKGEWNFKQLDLDEAMAEQHQVNLLLTLGQTPQWASSRPNDPPPWRLGGPAPPTNEEDWKTFVRTIALRYQGRIHEYEIWNEPNLKESYSGTQEQLVALAKDAYQIIHEVDPNAIVVSPGVIQEYGLRWFSRYLDLGGAQYADVIGYHFYTDNNPEYAAKIIQQVRVIMKAHGVEKPLWNTESGYQNHSDFEDVQPPQNSGKHVRSSEDILAYVMRAYILNWASGVSRLYWYDWDSNSMGLGDNLGKQKKPAASGYATVERWLLGATVRDCEADASNNWTCELTRNNRREWIVWNSEEEVTKAIPDTWKVKEFETLLPDGTTKSGNIAGKHSISSSPIPMLLR